MTCRRPDVARMLGSYVLGACTDDEVAAVRAHLPVCSSCNATLAVLAPAREGLLADVAPIGPPARLKPSIMRQVRADAALFAAARAPEPAPRRLPRRPSLAWAAATVAACGVAIMLFLGGSDRETIYAARVDGALAPGGRASIAVHDGRTRLQVSDLPPAGTGRMYEVWMRDGAGAPRPANVRFAVDAGGDAVASIPGAPRRGQEIIVTSEVGGRATTPSASPILRIGL